MARFQSEASPKQAPMQSAATGMADRKATARCFMDDPCDSLPGRLRQICRGETGGDTRRIPEEMRADYIRLWVRTKLLPRSALSLIDTEYRHGAMDRISDFFRKVRLFLKTVKAFVLSGFRRTTKSETERRLSICSTCELFDAESASCKKCGCRMKIKAQWRVASCPLKKW